MCAGMQQMEFSQGAWKGAGLCEGKLRDERNTWMLFFLVDVYTAEE